jgi:riboflavin kinase/FMN adenylyltransferase
VAKNFITVGSFDGLHLGHKRLLRTLKNAAAENKMKPFVLYFAQPPKMVMGRRTASSVITPPVEKRKLLQNFGLKAIEIDFSKVGKLSHKSFFEILIRKHNMGGFLTGRDFAFGKKRLGRLDFLKEACRRAGAHLLIADFERDGKGRKISSSLIRELLNGGDIAAANALLGRPYCVVGKVVKGRRIGRTLGFPTANLDAPEQKLLPRGVFAAAARLGSSGKTYKAVVNIGSRPTVNKTAMSLMEVHIIGFKGNIYGKTLAVDFIGKIRDEKEFSSLMRLRTQIEKDVAAARELFSVVHGGIGKRRGG